jgi:hypothetical protein
LRSKKIIIIKRNWRHCTSKQFYSLERERKGEEGRKNRIGGRRNRSEQERDEGGSTRVRRDEQ